MRTNQQSLRPGVRLHGVDLESRVRLSSGTVEALSVAPHLSYRANASVPRRPWRRPSDAELAILLAVDERFDDSRAIALVKLIEPAELSPTMQDPGLAPRDFDRAVRAALLSCIDAIVPLSRGEQLAYVGAARSVPGLPTATRAPEGTSHLPEHLGLHFDFPDSTASGASRAPWSRLCVNLGAESRYFLFVNLLLPDVRRAVDSVVPHISDTGPELGDAFCRLNRDYPVVRLEVRPGEAYIAPTQFIVHDATTQGKHVVDVCAHLAGNFRIDERPRPSLGDYVFS